MYLAACSAAERVWFPEAANELGSAGAAGSRAEDPGCIEEGVQSSAVYALALCIMLGS